MSCHASLGPGKLGPLTSRTHAHARAVTCPVAQRARVVLDTTATWQWQTAEPRRRVHASSAGLQRTGGPNPDDRGECGQRTHTVALGRSSHGVRVVPECRAVGVPAVVALPSRTVCCTVRSCAAAPYRRELVFVLVWGGSKAPGFPGAALLRNGPKP